MIAKLWYHKVFIIQSKLLGEIFLLIKFYWSNLSRFLYQLWLVMGNNNINKMSWMKVKEEILKDASTRFILAHKRNCTAATRKRKKDCAAQWHS